jgi:pimeloyl-ACP methyl ester carboxylesterase
MNPDVYVLVPGILGSVLQKDGKDVFGLTAEAGFRALFSGGHSITDLQLSEPAWPPADVGDEEIRPVPDLGDGVIADRLAVDAHLIPGLWKVDGYGEVGKYLRKKFGLVPGQNYFEFPYDWRRDNRVAAHQLAASSREWLASRRQQYPDAQLVLIGHSMGGLVSRYFLEVLGGWRDTRRLITFGTPYRGSLNAVDFVANGFTRFFGLVDLTDMLCSFTSVHQLLPIYPCVDTGGPKLARLTEVPEVLPRLTREQVEAARGFHKEIENAVARHREDDEYAEHGYQLRPVIGIDQPTYQSAAWQTGQLRILRSYDGKDLGGDGTVPRVSASPQEAKSDEDGMFSSDKHASLQNADGVHTQMTGWINQIDLGSFLAVTPEHVAVDTADVHQAGQPLLVQLTPSAPLERLVASLSWVGGPIDQAPPAETLELSPVVSTADAEFAAKDPGVYRMQVEGDEIEPVSDLVVVAPA